jgi:hypothetical protein
MTPPDVPSDVLNFGSVGAMTFSTIAPSRTTLGMATFKYNNTKTAASVRRVQEQSVGVIILSVLHIVVWLNGEAPLGSWSNCL